MKKKLKITLLTIAIAYTSVTLIAGLFWFWFGAHLNFFGEQGVHYDISAFFSGCAGAFWFICPFVTAIALFIEKNWKVALGFIGWGLLSIFLIFGVGIFMK